MMKLVQRLLEAGRRLDSRLGTSLRRKRVFQRIGSVLPESTRTAAPLAAAVLLLVLAATALIFESPSRTVTSGPGQVSPLAPGEGTETITSEQPSLPSAAATTEAARRSTAGTAAGPSGATNPKVVAVGGTMKLGIITPSGNPGAAFGINATQDSDTNRRVAKALVDEINETGGFAGRQLVPVIVDNDNTDQSQSNQTRIQNEICVRLTEDEKVYMVFAFADTSWVSQCYINHKTPVFPIGRLGAGTVEDEEEAKRNFPWILPTFAMNLTRTARLLPTALEEQGFMTQKMGLIGFERAPEKRAAEQIIIPGIEARGGKVLDKQYVPVGYDGVAAGMASAVLRFSGLQIDRVVVWSGSNGAWLIFDRQAQTQGYHPRYGITSRNDPIGYILFDTEQLKGSLGVGWYPNWDTNYRDPNSVTSKERACWNMLNRRAGTNFQTKSANPTDIQNSIPALQRCDSFYLMREALRPAATVPLAGSQIADYFFNVGTGYDPITLPKSRFSPGKLDGVEVYAHLRFDDTNENGYVYSSPFKTIP